MKRPFKKHHTHEQENNNGITSDKKNNTLQMKTIFIFILTLMIGSPLSAQETEEQNKIKQNNSNEVQTLFKTSKEKGANGGYGALTVGYTTIDNYETILLGARGVWIINHSFGIGLGGYGFITDPQQDSHFISDEFKSNNEFEYAGGYGGLILEPILLGKKPIHLSFPILIGAGGISYTTTNNDEDWRDVMDENYDVYIQDYYEDSDAYFVIEPCIELEFNMVRHMRIALTASYRYTSNINLHYKKDNARIGSENMLTNWNAGLIFKFGKF